MQMKHKFKRAKLDGEQSGNNFTRVRSLNTTTPIKKDDKLSDKDKNIPGQPKKLKTSLKIKYGKYSKIIIVIVLILVVYNLFIFTSYVNITITNPNVEAYDNLLAPNYIQKRIDSYFNSSIYNKLKLTIDSSAFGQYMTNQFPEISSGSLVYDFLGNGANIYLSLKQPNLTYQTIGDKLYYFINDQGDIVGYTNQLSQVKQLDAPLVESTITPQISLGSSNKLLTNSEVNFISTVNSLLVKAKKTVQKFVIIPSKEEVDCYLVSTNYYIRFNLASNQPQLEVGTYLATLATLNKQNITPNQYIDVMVEGRAYFK